MLSIDRADTHKNSGVSGRAGLAPAPACSRAPCRSDVHGFGLNTSLRWYVVHTQPHAEGRAIVHLERQGFRTFCPRFRKTVRHARKAIRTLAPLFPNYVFVQLDVTRDPWRSVNGTYGVIRLIMQGDAPQPVPRGIVEALLSRIVDGAIDWAPTLKIGQAVKIVEGPFADFVGTLEQLDSAGRVRVLLDLLGRSVSVALPSEALAPAA